MFQKIKISLFILWFIPMVGIAQTMADASYDLEKRMPLEEWSILSENNLPIHNIDALYNFLEQLQHLYTKKTGKVRIAHIGDSHIQAGFFPSKSRKDLQRIFGNAGLGFTFPHRLAKTNGIMGLKYSSSIPWESKRNIFATDVDPVGLSGFSLHTKHNDFAIALNIEEEEYAFNSLRIITPNRSPMFSVAKAIRNVELKNHSTQRITHTIKSGEALSIIARKYGVTINQIKQANNLRSDVIRAGGKLIIPIKTDKPEAVDRSAFEILPFKDSNDDFVYHSSSLQKSIWLLPNEDTATYALNGVVLERDNPGLIYDGIGVNGARFKDYNKTKLFFEQLQELHPDLLVVSLGTNESFDELDKDTYISDLKLFIKNIKHALPETSLLFTTPPPSLVKRSTPNMYAEEYAEEIKKLVEDENIAVWDLYNVLGGNKNIKKNYNDGLVAQDYIHYTKEGYELTGTLFTEALLQAFFHYSINQRN